VAVLFGLAFGLSVCAPATVDALVIGVGDQTPTMFKDPRFLALRIGYARFDVAWDAIDKPAEREKVGEWLAAARKAGVEPLVSFDHDYRRRWHRTLPSPARFATAFSHFHARFPWVHDFATWNEANYCGEPTCHRAARVAAYYLAMRRVCAHCNVLAAELLDVGGMVAWIDQFRAALHGEPAIWGLHNYVGANRLRTTSTAALLKATSAPIWFTETGGIVSRNNHSSLGFPESATHAAAVTRFIFDRLARLSPRVQRIYIYQWDGAGPRASWDSGLIGPNGKVRPAYADFVYALALATGQLRSVLPRGSAARGA
jgi:hypothetical protein